MPKLLFRVALLHGLVHYALHDLLPALTSPGAHAIRNKGGQHKSEAREPRDQSAGHPVRAHS